MIFYIKNLEPVFQGSFNISFIVFLLSCFSSKNVSYVLWRWIFSILGKIPCYHLVYSVNSFVPVWLGPYCFIASCIPFHFLLYPIVRIRSELSRARQFKLVYCPCSPDNPFADKVLDVSIFCMLFRNLY